MEQTLNSTLGNIAAACEEIYNNGRVVPTDEKLTYDDFLQLCYIEFGDIAAIQYYKELRAGNASYYFSSLIQVVLLDIKNDKGYYPYVELEDLALLPYMGGIVAVYPFVKDEPRDPDDDYTKMPVGSESLYSKPKLLDDLGYRFFVTKGKKIELYGGDGKGTLGVEYIPINEDVNVTQQIGKVIIGEVLKKVMPSKQEPTDTHEDTDPNLATYKQRLDQPQSIN